MNGIRQKSGISESVWFYIAAFLLGGALHFADRLTVASLNGGLPSQSAGKALFSTVLFTLNLCVYVFAIARWFLSVRTRLLPSRGRTYLSISAIMMAAFLLDRAVKYRVAAEGSLLQHVAWYAYYVPLAIIPTMFLLTCLGAEPDSRRKRAADHRGHRRDAFQPEQPLHTRSGRDPPLPRHAGLKITTQYKKRGTSMKTIRNRILPLLLALTLLAALLPAAVSAKEPFAFTKKLQVSPGSKVANGQVIELGYELTETPVRLTVEGQNKSSGLWFTKQTVSAIGYLGTVEVNQGGVGNDGWLKVRIHAWAEDGSEAVSSAVILAWGNAADVPVMEEVAFQAKLTVYPNSKVANGETIYLTYNLNTAPSKLKLEAQNRSNGSWFERADVTELGKAGTVVVTQAGLGDDLWLRFRIHAWGDDGSEDISNAVTLAWGSPTDLPVTDPIAFTDKLNVYPSSKVKNGSSIGITYSLNVDPQKVLFEGQNKGTKEWFAYEDETVLGKNGTILATQGGLGNDAWMRFRVHAWGEDGSEAVSNVVLLIWGDPTDIPVAEVVAFNGKLLIAPGSRVSNGETINVTYTLNTEPAKVALEGQNDVTGAWFEREDVSSLGISGTIHAAQGGLGNDVWLKVRVHAWGEDGSDAVSDTVILAWGNPADLPGDGPIAFTSSLLIAPDNKVKNDEAINLTYNLNQAPAKLLLEAQNKTTGEWYERRDVTQPKTFATFQERQGGLGDDNWIKVRLHAWGEDGSDAVSNTAILAWGNPTDMPETLAFVTKLYPSPPDARAYNGEVIDLTYTLNAEPEKAVLEALSESGDWFEREDVTCLGRGGTIHATNAGLGDDIALTVRVHAWADDGSEAISGELTLTWGRPGSSVFRFDDVKDESKFYFTPVYWAVNHEPQVTNGATPTTFNPDGACTRGHVVTFLWRAAGEPAPSTASSPFTDLKESAFYYTAVLWAVEKGITTGATKTTFAPGKPCTRGQIVTFLWRFKNSPEPTTTENPFGDVAEKAFYYKAVLWAVENKVTSGTGAGKFSPDNTCTRGQVVTFLYRASGG